MTALSKLNSGPLFASPVTVELREAVQKSMSLSSFEAAIKRINLVCEFDPSLSSFQLDPIILNHLLSQAIAHAVRYSPVGSDVTVEIRRNKSRRRGTLLFIVRDTGMGFEEEGHDTLLLRKLSLFLGGEFWSESTPGLGSEMYFTVNALEVDSKSADESLILPLKILLVDDSLDNRNLILAYLRKYPFDIRTAENGSEALMLMKENHYDLVLMDIQMPIMDGLTATRMFREWEKENQLTHLPIAALTAYALNEDHNRSIDAGCDLHITKPVKKVTILESIKVLLTKAA